MPSSVIRRFTYDPGERRVRVTFTSGAVYDYFDVPPQIEEAWRAAFSKGQYFARHIRDRYPFRLVKKGAPQDPGSRMSGDLPTF